MASPALAPIRQPLAQPQIANQWRPRAFWLAVPLFILIALAAIHSFYRFGINETDDSAIYFSAAASPIHNARLTTDVGDPAGTPLTHYPPLYSLLLAGGKALGGSYLKVAAILDFTAYLFSCFAVCWFVSRFAPPAWALVALALLLCSGPIYHVFSLIGPDGPAIALMILSMCFIGEYVRKADRRFLVLCGVALAAATLLRYVCGAFVVAACLATLLDERETWKHKLRSALLLAAIASAPLAGVLLLNTLLGGSPTDRSVHLHLLTASAMRDMIQGLSTVFLSYGWPFPLRAALLGVAAVIVARVTFVRGRFGEAARIAGIFLGVYLLLLVVSMSFFDAATPFDDRILAPAVALLCILLAIVCCSLWRRAGQLGKLGVGAVLLIGVAFSASHAHDFLKTWAQARSAAHLRQEYSALLPLINALPPRAAIYTNVPFDLYLVTGRNARTLPRVVGYTDLVPRPETDIAAHVRDMRNQLAATNGLIIYKLRKKTLWDAGLLSQPELTGRIPALVQLPGHGTFALYGLRSTTR